MSQTEIPRSASRSIGRTHGGEDIAGWILKGDPNVYDLDSDLKTGEGIGRWSVYDNYRKDLMADGQRCILWRSGPKGAIVAAGYIRGPVERDDADPSQWVDQSKARAAEWFVPVELYPLDQEILRAELKAHPVISRAEFLRAKQMSNPTVVTAEELDAIEELLAGHETWPLPFLAIIGMRSTRFGVDVAESGDGFSVFEEGEDGDFVKISDHESTVEAILTAASAASEVIDTEPVIDWADGGTLVGRLITDDERLIGLYKVADGYVTGEYSQDEDDVYVSDEMFLTLPALLRWLLEVDEPSVAESVTIGWVAS